LQDIEAFTSLAQQCETEDIMNMLHTLFSVFDALSAQHGVFKVETIGKFSSHGSDLKLLQQLRGVQLDLRAVGAANCMRA
jgi:class 3 adenylate cyclase